MAANILSRALQRLRQDPLGFIASIPGKIAGRLAKRLVAPASRNGFLASLYFTFFSKRFYREHTAVLQGMVEYRATRLAQKTSFGGFRRNVHRIEKGMSMQPLRPVFAEGYILETVAQFKSAASASSKIDAGERKWAQDILRTYFDTVSDTPTIQQARAIFEAAASPAQPDADLYIPYEKQTLTQSNVAFEDLRKLFIERRSVRWFEDRPVPKDMLEQAVEAAGWAPTACNRQPYRFYAFHGARAAEIGGLAGGTAGWLHQIPCMIVVVGDMSNYIEERDRHLIYIDGSLAAMQMMLALQSLGLSSTPINWPDVDEREAKMQSALGLKVYERPIMLMAVGYGTPEGKIPYSQKKPVDLMLVDER